jgi:hypothetical protein
LQNSGADCAARTKDVALNKKVPNKLTTERYLARFRAEKAMLARDYCNTFKFWRTCPFKRCLRARTCSGDQTACLKRREGEVPRDIQWQARQQILATTPANAGPPERMVREFLPGGLV